MPRWEPNAVGRLQQAAIELFEQHGVAGTTVVDIATRAGLTERTFFNHFAAKADVLFGPRAELHRQVVVQEITASDETLVPLDAVVRGLQIAADKLFQDLRVPSIRRRKIIDADPALREREDGKRAALTAGIAAALHDRGLDPQTAMVVARAGVLVQQTAEESWARHTEPPSLRDHLAQALTALRNVV